MTLITLLIFSLIYLAIVIVATNIFGFNKHDSEKNVKYYHVSLIKLTVYSLLSLGLYQFYWFYRNWENYRGHRGSKHRFWRISSILRSLFSVVFCYSLFRKILTVSKFKDGKTYSPVLISFIYIFFMFSLKIPNSLPFLYLFSFVPLLFVQKTINFHN